MEKNIKEFNSTNLKVTIFILFYIKWIFMMNKIDIKYFLCLER